MDITQVMMKMDFDYLESFTERKDTQWGCLFYDVDNPTYYDANHAYVKNASVKPEAIIDEVINFYTAMQIIPRFYVYDIVKQQPLIKALEQYGFRTKKLESIMQRWNKELPPQEQKTGVTIEIVTDKNFKEAMAIECSIKEFGSKELREIAFTKEFSNPAFTHYLLRYNGKACSTACIFVSGENSRLEGVATLEAYRKKGLIGDLIHYIQADIVARKIENLYVSPINAVVEKVYLKYGFQTVGKTEMIHAFHGGRSILEIHE